jgi:hypothetical protein
MSSIHYTLATTHLYNSKEKTTNNPIEEMEKALEHYETSKKVSKRDIICSLNLNVTNMYNI